jgi:hypothetical protein
MHCNECSIHSSLKNVSFCQYFFCHLTVELFDHVFFITFDVDCDGDGLFIASVQGVENGRELCETIEGPFCTVRGFKLGSQSKLACRECILNLLEEQRENWMPENLRLKG